MFIMIQQYMIKEQRERELLVHDPKSSLEVIIAMESSKKF